MQKLDIRTEFKEKRKSLSLEDKINQSKKIAQVIVDNFNIDNKVVSVYLPIERFNEIDTSFLIHKLKKAKAKIHTPVSDFNTLELKHLIYDNNTIIKNNEWGIPEPMNGESIEPFGFDIVFVPLLAVDVEGYRVGYGKGFYDRFLSQCRSDTIFIGLNYFENLVEIDDLNDSDIPIHFLVTPNRILKF